MGASKMWTLLLKMLKAAGVLEPTTAVGAARLSCRACHVRSHESNFRFIGR
jgi:hypothetical protein